MTTGVKVCEVPDMLPLAAPVKQSPYGGKNEYC